jgi:hypothetical protein
VARDVEAPHESYCDNQTSVLYFSYSPDRARASWAPRRRKDRRTHRDNPSRELRPNQIFFLSSPVTEVRELCQRATVLRNGRSIGTVGLEDATDHNIFEMMVGRSQAEEMQRRAATGPSTRPAVLEAEGLAGGSLKNISLSLREGEILGVAGLEGQGQRAHPGQRGPSGTLPEVQFDEIL